jgi:hypothetical protein
MRGLEECLFNYSLFQLSFTLLFTLHLLLHQLSLGVIVHLYLLPEVLRLFLFLVHFSCMINNLL